MANIRVNCPTCKAELEIGQEYLGKEVECGSCLQPFKVEDAKPVKKPYKMQRSRTTKTMRMKTIGARAARSAAVATTTTTTITAHPVLPEEAAAVGRDSPSLRSSSGSSRSP